MTPLTVKEARAILIADEALQRSFDGRQAASALFEIAELDAWTGLVNSARQRVDAWENARKAIP